MSTSSESTAALFVEYDEVIELIESFPTIDNSKRATVDAANINEYKSRSTAINSRTTPIQNGNQALSRFKQIFDKYLECPTLLDAKLESILSLLSKKSIGIIHELYDYLLFERQEKQPTTTRTDEASGDIEKSENTLGSENYSETEHGIRLEMIHEQTKNTEALISDQEKNHALKIKILKRYMSAIYSISKVRGYKHVAKYLSHETKDVEPVLCVLRHMEDISEGKYTLSFQPNDGDHSSFQEPEIAENWESIYVLLLWLGILSLVPFDLNTIDSTMIESLSSSPTNNPEENINNVQNPNSSARTLISSMITTILKHLNDASVTRIIASSSLAKLFSRPDLEEDELKSFVMFSNQVLLSFLSKSNNPNGDNDMVSSNYYDSNAAVEASNFLVMGIIQTLANIFKTGNRSTLMERHLTLVEILWENTILLSEELASSSSGVSSTSMLLRKLLVKLFARVGCSYLPPRIASWRYQRGKRSLLENLSKAAINTIDSKSSSANITDDAVHNGHLRQTTANGENANENNNEKHEDDDSGFFHVPDQVEDSMAQMMQYLTDPSSAVRWSVAKGIGRLTERLPILCADDVLDALLELCTNEQNYENDFVWHGSCLTLAELARRGLLLPSRLAEVMPIVIQAIQYDIPKGSNSVGSHVRDAACYVCWAFARAYAPTVLQPFVQELSKAIVVASLFDREINCRRAASASFQECVGRQGANNFKHGIEILTTADYFTLGNRVESFTSIAKKIAIFEEYRHPIIDHLYEEKLFHWDAEIRRLSSISLRMLTSLEPEYFTTTLLPDLLPLCTNENLTTRHGAVIGIAEIVLALGGWSEEEESKEKPSKLDLLSDEQKVEIANVVTRIEKARLYRGRGGEVMRAAVSRFIECLSKARIPLGVKQQVGLLDSLDVNLKHPNEDIQIAAAKALSSLMTEYFPVGSSGPSERLQNRVVRNYVKLVREEENPAATRGYTLALGHLPAKLLAFNKETLDLVISCLCQAANHKSTVGQQGDAETRRNAIQSIVRICETVGIGENHAQHLSDESPVVGIGINQTKQIFNCLLECTQDYNTDRRGDVGSWSRIAAMKGLVTLTLLSVKASDIPQQLSPDSQKASISSHELMVVPDFKVRVQSSFESNASEAVQESIAEGRPYRVNQQQSSKFEMYFDDEICSLVLGSILKQLAEKLDAVRTQAGCCLELLLSGPSVIPFTPRKQMLLEGLNLANHQPSEHTMNWRNPDVTFPLLMRVINIDTFFHPIISGLVVSVGGLTESVTNSSSKAFLDYCRVLKQTKLIGKLSKIGRCEYTCTYFWSDTFYQLLDHVY